MKTRPFARDGFHPNPSAVAFDNLFADGQPDACAGILIASVQPLEDDKNSLEILRVDSNPVIAHTEVPNFAGRRGLGRCVVRFPLDRDMDFGRLLVAELDRIADQVLKQLSQLCGISHDTG